MLRLLLALLALLSPGGFLALSHDAPSATTAEPVPEGRYVVELDTSALVGDGWLVLPFHVDRATPFTLESIEDARPTSRGPDYIEVSFFGAGGPESGGSGYGEPSRIVSLRINGTPVHCCALQALDDLVASTREGDSGGQLVPGVTYQVLVLVANVEEPRIALTLTTDQPVTLHEPRHGATARAVDVADLARDMGTGAALLDTRVTVRAADASVNWSSHTGGAFRLFARATDGAKADLFASAPDAPNIITRLDESWAWMSAVGPGRYAVAVSDLEDPPATFLTQWPDIVVLAVYADAPIPYRAAWSDVGKHD